MKNKRKHINALLFFLLYGLFLCLFYSIEGIHKDYNVLFSNMIIVLLSLFFMIAGDKYNFSLNKIFMLFSFLFFGVAPIIQYQKGITLWTNQQFTNQNYFQMNILIIFILCIYQFFYVVFSKINSSRLEYKLISYNAEGKCYSNYKLLTIAFLSLVLTLYVYNFDLASILLRSSISRISNQSLALTYLNFISPAPVICLILFKINNKSSKSLEATLWIILLTTNFPTSAARFYIAAIYLPLLIIYFKKLKQNYLLLNKFLIGGLLVVFPFLDQARSIRSLSDLTLKLDFQMFSQEHFDSYQMFIRVVVENIITYGNQLFTALLFFVPRFIWAEKSVGSGYFVASKYGFVFNNVSMNYFGEGYINFGFFGIFIFILMIAYFNSRYDKLYWEKLRLNSPFRIFYILSLGLQFFYLRGDMLSGNAFITGILVSLITVHKFSVIKYKRNLSNERGVLNEKKISVYK